MNSWREPWAFWGRRMMRLRASYLTRTQSGEALWQRAVGLGRDGAKENRDDILPGGSSQQKRGPERGVRPRLDHWSR